MKGATGALLVAVGLLVLYLAVTGRLSRVPSALRQIWDGSSTREGGTPSGLTLPPMDGQMTPVVKTSLALPALPSLPALADPIYG